MQSGIIDRRERQRIVAMLLCEIEAVGMPSQLVRVRDLSNLGLRVVDPVNLGAQRSVRVRMPGSQVWVTARVAWSADGMTGLSFQRPIDLPAIPAPRSKLS